MAKMTSRPKRKQKVIISIFGKVYLNVELVFYEDNAIQISYPIHSYNHSNAHRTVYIHSSVKTFINRRAHEIEYFIVTHKLLLLKYTKALCLLENKSR